MERGRRDFDRHKHRRSCQTSRFGNIKVYIGAVTYRVPGEPLCLHLSGRHPLQMGTGGWARGTHTGSLPAQASRLPAALRATAAALGESHPQHLSPKTEELTQRAAFVSNRKVMPTEVPFSLGPAQKDPLLPKGQLPQRDPQRLHPPPPPSLLSFSPKAPMFGDPHKPPRRGQER